jgi:predicted glutamine amidotransferase
VVASEVLGSNEEEWGTIPPRTLAVLIPGRMPQFHAVQFTSQNSATPGLGATPEPAATPSPQPTPEPPRPAGLAESPHNCRFWGLIGAGYPVSLMTDHLWDGEYMNLRELSDSLHNNDDGWGLAYFVPDAFELPLNSPVIRRGGPAAQHDDDYQITVYEMRAIAPPVAIGHVRKGTSGHTGIPNPHPFQHRGMLFAHNGGLLEGPLEDRLGDDLTTHPADYTPGSEGTGYIDSELCFLYLLKLIDERPGVPFPEALLEALREVAQDADVIGSPPKLNFVLTDGDTLYALHCYGYGTSYSVRYYPAGSGGGHEASPYWVVASEPLGLTSDGWGTIPARTLAVFVPGEAPRFMPLDGPQYSFGRIEIAERVDQDEDEWISQFALRCDPDMIVDSAEVFVRVSAAPAGEDWLELASSESAWIYGSDPDTFSIPCSVDTVDPDLPPTLWDLKVELYAAGADTLLVAVTHATHPEWGLGDVQVEGSARDTVPDLPREFAFAWVGRSGEVDEDGDGYLSSFHLQWDGNLSPEWDSVLVHVEALGFDGSRVISLGTTEDYWLRGLAPDTISLVVEVTPEDRLPEIWELALQMRDVEAQTVAASASSHDFAALSGVWVEGSDEDAPAPDSLEAWVGAVRPNPGPGNAEGRFEIPLNVPAGGAEVILEIWDATGRLIWQDGPRGLDAGRQEVAWYGRSLEGVAVPSGSYFGKIRIGEKIWRRCFVLVR